MGWWVTIPELKKDISLQTNRVHWVLSRVREKQNWISKIYAYCGKVLEHQGWKENPTSFKREKIGYPNTMKNSLTSVQFSSVAQSCPTLCDPKDCSTPGLPVHHQLPESTQTHVHWVGDAIQPSHPLSSLLLLPSIFPSIRVFSNESALCIRWPKYWSFSFNISPSNEHPGLISFRMDWLDLLAVQGTLKSLLQHHSSKASVLQCSAFFIVQLSHPHMTTGKNHSLD